MKETLLLKLSKIFILFLLFFLFSYFLSIFTFSKNEPTWDLDTPTYLYLIKPEMKQASFYSSQRPPIFPAYLVIISEVYDDYNINYVFINHVVRAITLALSSLIVLNLTKNLLFSFASAIAMGTNLQVLQYLNFINPEILLNLIVIVHIILVLSFIKKQNLYSFIFLIVSYSLLTFTKPVFLFLPLVEIPLLFAIKKICSNFSKKHFFLYSIITFLLYCLPILAWTKHTHSITGIYSFSIISDINLTEKLIRYDLISSGPDEDYFAPLKTALQPDEKIEHIYWRLPNILKVTPENVSMYKYMSDFTHKTIFQNSIRYIEKSLRLVPQNASAVSEYKSLIHISLLEQNPNQSSVFAYSIIWGSIRETYWILIVLVMLSLSLTIKSNYKNANSTIFIQWYLIFFLLYFYFIISFTAYDQVIRIKSPTQDVFVILLIISISMLINNLKNKFIHSSTQNPSMLYYKLCQLKKLKPALFTKYPQT